MKRLVVFLGLNAIVSVVVTLAVLWIWDTTQRNNAALPPAPSAASTAVPGTAEALQTQGVPPETAVAAVSAGQEQPTAELGGPPGLATITPTVYSVQSGDTLGSIAAQFDVSIEDLMAANGLTDPNVLDVGQALQIPIGGQVQELSTEAPVPTEAGSASPTEATPPESTGPAQLAIRGVLNAGAVAQERVTVVNVGGDVSLAGWTLHDEQGNVFFFPALSLFEGGAVAVHTTTGSNTVTDLYWNQTASIWESGETATLVDPTGATHTTFVVP